MIGVPSGTETSVTNSARLQGTPEVAVGEADCTAVVAVAVGDGGVTEGTATWGVKVAVAADGVLACEPPVTFVPGKLQARTARHKLRIIIKILRDILFLL
jgi:hypothetical protein